MPELPEVEVVRRGLEPAVTDARIAAVTVLDDRSVRRHPGPSEDFVDRLVGRHLMGAQRRGKFMWLPLDESEALVVHLGMSGQVLLRKPDVVDRFTRVRIEIMHPVHGALRLNFVDQRIFGSLAINDLGEADDGTGQWIPSSVTHIARDPLDPHFDDEKFFARLLRRRTGVKRAMLDQTLISGIGNIYADEALWAARIHYDQPTSSLSRRSARTLLAEVRLVLTKALAEGGTSFDTQYVDVNGTSGYFTQWLNAYAQQGKACARCGRIIVREKFMNRGSHFCPHCQRLRIPIPVPSS